MSPSKLALSLLCAALLCATIYANCDGKHPNDDDTCSEEDKQKNAYTLFVFNISSSTAAPSSTASPASSSSGSSASPASSSASPSSSSASSNVCYDPSSETAPCMIVEELERIKCSKLNSTQQVDFEVLIINIRIVVLNITLTVEQKLSACGQLIRVHFKNHPDHKDKCAYEKIGSYGYVDDVDKVARNQDASQAPALMASDANGETVVTLAIESASANDAFGPGTTAVIMQEMVRVKYGIKKMTVTWDMYRKMANFKKLIVKHLFFNNPGLEAKVRSIQIQGYYSVDQFLNLCGMFEMSTSTVSLVLPVLVPSVQSAINSGANSTNTTVLANAQGFCNNVSSYMSQQPNTTLQITFISAQFSSLDEDTRIFLKQVQIQGVSNFDFDDLMHTIHQCSGQGCGNQQNGPPCPSKHDLVTKDSGNNSTELQDVLAQFQQNLTGFSNTSQYNSFKNSIINCINGLIGNNPTVEDCCIYYINGLYPSNGGSQTRAMRKTFLATPFFTYYTQETTVSIQIATISIFCGCN